jgi:hypothetical protein
VPDALGEVDELERRLAADEVAVQEVDAGDGVGDTAVAAACLHRQLFEQEPVETSLIRNGRRKKKRFHDL